MLRLMLAVSVIFDHSPLYSASSLILVGGALAVQSFFVVSGFYMGLVLDTRYSDPRIFWSNRLIRLMPGYWVALAAMALYLALVGGEFFAAWKQLPPMGAAALGLANLGLLGQDLCLFAKLDGSFFSFTAHYQQSHPPLHGFLVLPQAWSLCLELYFYLLAPFLAKMKSGTLACIMMASLAGRMLALHAGLDDDPWTYRFFPFELFLFLAGMLAYRRYKGIQGLKARRFDLLALAALLLAILGLGQFPPLLLAGFSLRDWAYLGGLSLALPHVFRLTKSLSWDRLLGELSYPMYLNHLLALGLAWKVHAFGTSPMDLTWLTIALSALMGLLVVWKLERPLDMYRSRRAGLA
jgi:peptidoglycan/LPS O-acetylase OafA/YrhL